jgi:hypothetical protein
MAAIKKPSSKKQYPKFYERTVPIAIGLLVFAIVIMLVITFGVMLGYFGGAG